jgi:hypothetical protein
MRNDLVPAEAQIYAWIEEIFSHGVRRPAYSADRWAEEWLQDQLRALGLEKVRGEPVDVISWEPKSASLSIAGSGGEWEIPCFPLPLAAPTDALEAPVVVYDPENPEAVRGAIALCEVSLVRLGYSFYEGRATWINDPRGTFDGKAQVVPFGPQGQEVMKSAIEAGAVGFIGVLSDYPGDSYKYYVPYDAKHRPIPGVWIRGSNGQRLMDPTAAGSTRALIVVETEEESETTYNIVGELAGAGEDMVIIGSHHDGPWASAVEDGSGMALVLAQATYWSQVPAEERPHRLVFLLNAAHMYGGAGLGAFIATHQHELDGVVLELHLEHAASEFAEKEGVLAATGEAETRWWFTSRNERLEQAVQDALAAENLDRSLILPPEIFGPHPTTDGGRFHLAGVPLVNFLTAPFYLFDEMDTMDKIHRPSLEPVTRAAIRIIESTAGVSAAAMRSGQRVPAYPSLERD